MYDYFIKASIRTEEEGFHWHDLVEILSVLSGKMEISLNNQRYTLTEGDILVLNCDDVHRIERKSSHLLYACCHINTYAFNEMLPNISSIMFKCSPDILQEENAEAMKAIREKVDEIVLEFTKPEKGYENRAIYHAADLLAILRSSFSSSGKLPEKEKAASPGNTPSVYQYLYDNYTRKLTLKEAAQFAGLSEAALAYRIKADTGMTFEELINHIRTEYAIHSLLTTDKSPAEIAEACGFQSLKNFYGIFQKNYCCSPMEYRKKNKICFESQVRKAAYLHKIMHEHKAPFL